MRIPIITNALDATEKSPRWIYRCTWSRASAYFLGVAFGEVGGICVMSTSTDTTGLIYLISGTIGFAIGGALYTHLLYRGELKKER